MNNVLGKQEATLAVFGGLNTELPPSDLPQGLSPACSDIAFLPGSCFTRPSLQRLLALNNGAQIIYQHSYLRPNGSVVQLLFDSQGRIYADGVQIAKTAAGNRFYAINANGKCYVAVSDGLHGQDVPLQIDQYLNVDRVTQNGPGAPPMVTNYSIPPQQLVNGSAGTAVPVTTATPINPQQVQVGGGNDDPVYGGGYNPPQYQTFYTAIQYATGTPHLLNVGDAVTISGNSLYNFNAVYVSAVDSATVFEVSVQQQSSSTGNGGNVTKNAALLVRSNGSVLANTATPHNLRAGYRFVLSGVPDQSFTVSSIAINNDVAQGLATVTTSAPHGLVPGNTIALLNVPNLSIGFQNYTVSKGVATVNTSVNHNLHAGDQIILSLGSNGTPKVQTVTTVSSPTQFTATTGDDPVTTPNTNGSIAVAFPADSGQTFSVQTIPTPTTFTVALSGPSETWTGGTATFPWNGTFYVTGVTSATSFSYAQIGPDATVQSGSGTITPQGQIAPGIRTAWVIFLTRQGYLTRPSPPVKVNCAGNGYLFVSNIPIGPANVVARYIAFSGANGGNAYVLATPPTLSGQVLGTSTVVQDNTTTSAIFDFSDEALFASPLNRIDIPGNNLFAQIVLDSALGFDYYQSRLVTWGSRANVQAFLNLGFEGGTVVPNVPLGWTLNGSGTLTASQDYGLAWTPNGNATLSQNAYQDAYGASILTPLTQYTFRAWVNGTVTASFVSATQGVLASATIKANGAYAETIFSARTPVSIPADAQLVISGGIVDEISIVYTANPYNLFTYCSYVRNPEGFDGITGKLGPDDPHAVRAVYRKRDVLNMLTEGPRGARYEVENTPSGEPSSWSIRRMSTQCGAYSVWGQVPFEDWECWVSDTGFRIDIGETEKLSQEVQSFWDSINPRYKHLCVAANDPYARRVYILAPTGDSTVPNATMVLDYRELNTAGLLASAGTLKISGSGRVVTTDLTRKWSPWSIQANYCGLMALATGEAVMTFAGGGSFALGAVYELAEGMITGIDADYGPFWQNCTYSTAFLLDSETAQAMKLGEHRLLHGLLTVNGSGVGTMMLIPSVDSLANTKKATRALALQDDMTRDLEFANQVAGERVSYSIQAVPSGFAPQPATSPAGFRISSMTVALTTDPFAPVRGWNNG